jgi:hypothetical protein
LYASLSKFRLPLQPVTGAMRSYWAVTIVISPITPDVYSN